MQPLPYHDDRNHLRRNLLDASRDYFTFRYRPESGTEADSEKADHHIAAVLGSGYAYNLAAAIGWVARNVSEEAADGLAAWLSDSLTNGDDQGLNEDIEQATEAQR
jgi:hypothetical protein